MDSLSVANWALLLCQLSIVLKMEAYKKRNLFLNWHQQEPPVLPCLYTINKT